MSLGPLSKTRGAECRSLLLLMRGLGVVVVSVVQAVGESVQSAYSLRAIHTGSTASSWLSGLPTVWRVSE